jgi:hypothetical protein
MEKEEREGGCCGAAGLACLAGPRVWPSWTVALFFVLILFLFYALFILGFGLK